jgi:outer membrane protein assembly factor BamB
VPVLGVNHVWTARIGSIAGLPLDMHVSGHVVTLASADGVVVALDARSGADLWRTALGSLFRPVWEATENGLP